MLWRPATHSISKQGRVPHAILRQLYSTSLQPSLQPAPPVDLAYEHWAPERPQHANEPLLILHGLFGSKRNWHSLSKAFSRKLQRPVYALDLRNHGESPHAERMDYTTMANDVLQFCKKHSLDRIALLGHSMGGKVAMTLALKQDTPRDLLAHLIVGDISPIKGRISPDFQRYIDGMQRVERDRVKTKRAAYEILSTFEPDATIRAFLLTNLAPASDGAPLRFRVPLDIINRAVPDIGDFPFEPGQVSWDGKALFMKGSDSNYIQMKHVPILRQFFPNKRLESLEASHWLHAEKPTDFLEVVSQFLS